MAAVKAMVVVMVVAVARAGVTVRRGAVMEAARASRDSW